jgi:hypothetical protein
MNLEEGSGWRQVVGFVVLLVGTSMYNELLRSCLPDEGERRRRQLRVHNSSISALNAAAETSYLLRPDAAASL